MPVATLFEKRNPDILLEKKEKVMAKTSPAEEISKTSKRHLNVKPATRFIPKKVRREISPLWRLPPAAESEIIASGSVAQGGVMTRIFLALFFGLIHCGQWESALAADASVRCWVRGQGQHEDGELIKPQGERTIDLQALPKVTRVSKDIQYDGAQKSYVGINLATVVESCKLTLASVDMVLLHFANGMIVPMANPIAHANGSKVDAFVALGIKDKTAALAAFPPVGKKDEQFNDPRPIRFSSNKMVVSSGFHPDVPESSKENGFSPWLYVDSLTGIEFVNRRAWYAQFDLDAGARDGLKVYEVRCQYCHGARKVGASFGWDFVTPLAIYEKRDPKSLFNHLKYPKWDALQRGLMMPAQGKMTPAEAEALWRWLKAVGTAKHLKPYKI